MLESEQNSDIVSEVGQVSDRNSESTQHSSGTRKLQRVSKAPEDVRTAKLAALDRNRSSSSSVIKLRKPEEFAGVTLADGRYKVKSQLGKGSMAYVFLAADSRLETDVVIKVPKPEIFTTKDFRERFKRETQLLVKFSHPHVVSVLDIGEFENLPYVVMQLLSGGSLADQMNAHCNDKGQMELDSLKQWLPGVSRALDFCARKGMVHRDVKPANILFDEDGNAFVADFGLSKVMYGDQRMRIHLKPQRESFWEHPTIFHRKLCWQRNMTAALTSIHWGFLCITRCWENRPCRATALRRQW